jgi:23S rRNA (uridine2552-2'-O)-methyltransferase
MKKDYTKADYFSSKAKKEGYQARSVYKLKEIQKKFRVLNRGNSVLDIGAAPGSWSSYTVKLIGQEGRLTAVDLKDLSGGLKEDDRVTFIQGDFFDQKIIESIAENGPYEVIISDAAPATTGNRTTDTARSEALADHVLFIANSLLEKNGNLVIKIFQGGQQKVILNRLRAEFNTAKAYKPTATRKSSFEIYLIGIGKK